MTSSVRVLVIGENSSDFHTLKKQAEISEPRIQCIGFAHKEVPAHSLPSPDVVLVEGRSQDVIIDILSELQSLGYQSKVVVLSPFDDEEWMQQILEYGVVYCFLKPFDTPTLLRRLVQLVAQEWQSPEATLREQQRWQREQEITELLIEMGVPNHYNGFAYLKTAIAYVMEDETVLNRVTHVLYPFVADQYSVSPAHVERSIRHAIEVTWIRGNIGLIHSLFAHSIDQDKGKPTNSLFIARLADHLRLASPHAVF